jgi:hypothetical protein
MSLPLAATSRAAGALVVGAAVGVVGVIVTDTALGALIGVTAVHIVFVVSGWLVLWPLDADATRDHARREDFRSTSATTSA